MIKLKHSFYNKKTAIYSVSNYFGLTAILTLIPLIAFSQKFDSSFIQNTRDVEEVLVFETEGQKSWLDKTQNDTLHWQKEGFVIDEMPRMPGCENIKGGSKEKKMCAEQKMLEYIYANLVYPVEALEDRTEGRAIITFYVNPDGKLSNAKVKKDLGSYTGGAALDVIDKMSIEKTWKPGKSKGVAVPTFYTLPILFRLGPKNTIQHPKMYSKYYNTNDDWELVYDSEGASVLNEETQVRLLISDNGKALNARIFDPLTPVATERANEIILDLLNHSTWRPGSTYNFENTMEYVFTLKM